MPGILLIRLKGMGDIVHVVPSLRLLRQNHPRERIGFLCQEPFGAIIPPGLNIDVLQIRPKASFWETMQMIKTIRRKKFDRLVDFFCNPRTALLSLFSGIKWRAGFSYKIRRYAYHFHFVPEDSNCHLMRLFEGFLKEFSLISGDMDSPRLETSQKAISVANAFLSCSPSPLLGINVHATYPSKAWPIEHFEKFINLWYHRTHKPVLLFWGPGEENETRRLLARLPKGSAFTHNSLSIDELMAYLSRLDLFLTGDTGPMNLSWALGVPTIALFGPTTRKAVEPRGEEHLVLFNEKLSCLQCHKEVCEDGRCMSEMAPDWVLSQIESKFSGWFA